MHLENVWDLEKKLGMILLHKLKCVKKKKKKM